MSTSILTTKNRTSLPAGIVEAAQLKLNDEIYWTVDEMGIHGQKLNKATARPGRLIQDKATNLLFWSTPLSYQEMEEAALQPNPTRE